MPKQPEQELPQIKDLVYTHFNLKELQDLCFDLGIDYENFPTTRLELARELVTYLYRRGRLSELHDKCSVLRPNVTWDPLFKETNNQTPVRQTDSHKNTPQQTAQTHHKAEQQQVKQAEADPLAEHARSVKQREQAKQLEADQLYKRLKTTFQTSAWADALALVKQIDALEPNYKDVAQLAERARRGLERDRANQTAADQLYPHFKTAMDTSKWSIALSLAKQIDALVPNYKDIAQLVELARQGQRLERQQQLNKLWRQLQRFSVLGLGSGTVIGLIVLCVGGIGATVLLLPTLLPDNINTPSREVAPTFTIAPSHELNLPANPNPGDTWIRPTDSMALIYVPSGTFLMGSETNQAQSSNNDESPQHAVTLSSFWLDRTEVTNAMYIRCVSDKVCRESTYASGSIYNSPDYPVVGVSWDDADTYCKWAGGQLPSEAQWEYAARGTDGRLFPWGDESPTCSLAQFYDCAGSAMPVGSFSPAGDSWVGAADMAGNVWEWVADWYGSYSTSAVTDPTGPTSGDYKVVRGGSWGHSANNLRTVHRILKNPDLRYDNIGFRCAVLPEN